MLFAPHAHLRALALPFPVGITFSDPRWLWLIAIAIPAAILGLRWFASMTRLRAWSAVIFRAALIALIAGMLAGAAAVNRTDALAVVGVVDVSGSVRRFADPGRSADGKPIDPTLAAREFFLRASEGRGPDDLLGLVVFDGRAAAVATPTRADISDRSLDVSLAEGTDIASALRFASALIPPDAAGRLVLLTDGNETSGDALAAAAELAATSAAPAARTHAVPIDVVPLTYRVAREVMVESLDAPPRAAGESSITLRVTLFSTDGAKGSLNLLYEGEPYDINGDAPGLARPLNLPPGRHVELVTVPLRAGKVHRFKAVFEPDRADASTTAALDTQSANNSAEAFTVTPGKGTALVVDGVSDARPDGPGSTLARALRESGIDTTVVPPGGIPDNLLALQAYDIIFLENVPVEAVPDATQERLVSHVRDLGGGLVMIGGPDSFGAGGWKGSALEPILPVRLDLPEKLVMPDAAIALVLDNSGSMGRGVSTSLRSQQQIANESAALAVRTLDKKDLVCIIAFNSDPDVIVPMAPNDDPKATAERIRSIAPGGGTNIGPALEAAKEQFQGVRASVKHIIVLTDGLSMNREILPGMCADLAKDGITVSTIAVGDAADVPTMSAMAAAGNGVFYNVTNPGLLPRFFLKAVRIIRSPLIREGRFDPVLLPTGSPLTTGLQKPPPLLGLVLTQPRPEPTITYAMAAPTGEPLLAHWAVGLGHVAAFTSDAHEWAAPWLPWPGYRQMWTQIARVIARPTGGSPYRLDTEVAGDTLRLRVDATGEDGRPVDLLNMPVTLYAPDGSTQDITLAQSGPGLYEGSAPARDTGNYVAVVKPAKPGGERLTPLIGGASVASGVEYRRLSSNTALLREIAEKTGGRLLDLRDPGHAALFDRAGVSPSIARTPIWRALLIWAVIVLLLDIATRRVAWDRYISREFGADWKRAAEEAVRDRGVQAGRVLDRLRVRPARAPGLAGAASLTDTDAARVAAAEAQRRKRSREEALETIRASRRAQSTTPAPAPQQNRDRKGAASTPPANDAPRSRPDNHPDATPADDASGLLAAKKRARKRFDEDEPPPPPAKPKP